MNIQALICSKLSGPQISPPFQIQICSAEAQHSSIERAPLSAPCGRARLHIVSGVVYSAVTRGPYLCRVGGDVAGNLQARQRVLKRHVQAQEAATRPLL